jgi:hypothetical protein
LSYVVSNELNELNAFNTQFSTTQRPLLFPSPRLARPHRRGHRTGHTSSLRTMSSLPADTTAGPSIYEIIAFGLERATNGVVGTNGADFVTPLVMNPTDPYLGSCHSSESRRGRRELTPPHPQMCFPASLTACPSRCSYSAPASPSSVSCSSSSSSPCGTTSRSPRSITGFRSVVPVSFHWT